MMEFGEHSEVWREGVKLWEAIGEFSVFDIAGDDDGDTTNGIAWQ